MRARSWMAACLLTLTLGGCYTLKTGIDPGCETDIVLGAAEGRKIGHFRETQKSRFLWFGFVPVDPVDAERFRGRYASRGMTLANLEIRHERTLEDAILNIVTLGMVQQWTTTYECDVLLTGSRNNR